MTRKVGRPLKFEPSELEGKIDAYFEKCGIDELGCPSGCSHMPPTVSGMACYLGTTRDLLCDYEERDEFSDTIKKAKQKIEAYAEYALMTRSNVAGVIFNLKNNFGWKDKAEIKNSFDAKESPVRIYLPDNGRDKNIR